jgi:hypothetical protein
MPACTSAGVSAWALYTAPSSVDAESQPVDFIARVILRLYRSIRDGDHCSAECDVEQAPVQDAASERL